jgi:hypothetical protein
MAVNYCGILTLEKVGLKYHGNLPRHYHGNLTRYGFITLAPGASVIKLFTAVSFKFF